MKKSLLDTNLSHIDSAGATHKRLMELEHRFGQLSRSLNDLRDPIKIVGLEKLCRDTAIEGQNIATQLGIRIPIWCRLKS